MVKRKKQLLSKSFKELRAVTNLLEMNRVALQSTEKALDRVSERLDFDLQGEPWVLLHAVAGMMTDAYAPENEDEEETNGALGDLVDTAMFCRGLDFLEEWAKTASEVILDVENDKGLKPEFKKEHAVQVSTCIRNFRAELKLLIEAYRDGCEDENNKC